MDLTSKSESIGSDSIVCENLKSLSTSTATSEINLNNEQSESTQLNSEKLSENVVDEAGASSPNFLLKSLSPRQKDYSNNCPSANLDNPGSKSGTNKSSEFSKKEDNVNQIRTPSIEEPKLLVHTSPKSDLNEDCQSQSHHTNSEKDELANKSISTNIPENILSPPKSETQTDGTNTASSSSPASDSQQSTALAEMQQKNKMETDDPNMNLEESAEEAAIAAPIADELHETHISQPINVTANGTIPISGKPLMSALNKKINKTSSRPLRRRKSKALVAMYESEISASKIGIKLCIKKSDSISTTATTGLAPQKTAVNASKATTSTKTNTRKRSRKSKSRQCLDSDDSDYETRRKKGNSQHGGAEQRQKRVGFAAAGSDKDASVGPLEQSVWGSHIPEEVLYKIFQYVINDEGCLPTLFRLGRICSLWRRVSLFPTLWKTLDLTTWKEKHRTELKLKWFIDNRCSSCTDLNVSNWKVTDINCFLHKLAAGCPNLVSITLSGWKNLSSDNLTFLVDNMKKLERLDMSSINVEMTTSKSAVGAQPLCYAVQKMNGRLTHLYLAHNRLACIPQIVNILSIHCPNLTLLDFSNVSTQATSHGVLHIEKLQHGCQKLKVLRITNSHVTLSSASLQEMMDSPGFPDLEELSVAALTDESRLLADEHLQRILKTSSKLKLLDVRGCTRLTHESLIRLPAWDVKHLFLSGCLVTRDVGSGLELIASKWAHSLIELDLAWANVQQPLDNALRAIAEKGSESLLAHLNLCGSSVSEEAVKDILANCAHMSSINLSSCRGLPRGVKRLMQGPNELQELRDVLKVTMKVKLPSQIKKEQEEAAEAANVQMKNEVDVIKN